SVWGEAASEERLAREGLAAYARHPLLRAVGLDRTFYAPLPAAELARLAAQVPEDFSFLVKAWQAFTSPALPGAAAAARNARFLDAARAADEVVAPAAEGLGRRLGAILFQLPPLSPKEVAALGGPEALVDRLAAFLASLPRGPRYAVELRTRALLGPRYREALAAAGAAHSYVVHPSMPGVAAQAAVVPPSAGPAVLVRWMLGHGLGYERARERYAPFDRLAAPDPASRAGIAELCRAALALEKDVVVVVNNKAEGSAPRSVFALAEAIAGG
ncbi:MAG TPA: DUF72 domain-containing protein, partial [Anaeromyxobacteraceae bacterium]|nr:DUF72 domain-containing protein [Anaeromyxobacteraceae bacterium]